MSFAGDLEHLPLVDVIQLLHSTRKTGTLCLRSHKGESQLVFSNGCIVSSNHTNNSVRIGQILFQMKVITHEELCQGLNEQKKAGINRKPLVATLIDAGYVKQEEAYAGLENLIEMTIVEVMTWTKGTFLLDVDSFVISDEYRYFPEALNQEILLNTQSVLMEALRIYDEKMRDGALTHGAFSTEDPESVDSFGVDYERIEITLEDLGLGDIDTLDKKIPDVFIGLKDYDPAEIHRQKIREELQQIPLEDQERFLNFLLEFPEISNPLSDHNNLGPALAVIVFSQDELIKHSIQTICKHENLFVFTTDEEENLDHIIGQALSKELIPFLVVDSPECTGEKLVSENILALLKQKRELHPEISILQLIAPGEYNFSLSALQAGARTIFPRPVKNESPDTFVDDSIKFLRAFQAYMKTSFFYPDQQFLLQFKKSMFKLGGLMEAPEVSFVALNFVSSMFERAITFVVGTSELTAEKTIGVTEEKSAGATRSMMFKIPLVRPSVVMNVIESGRLFYGQSNDINLKNHLFKEIGVPSSPKIVLVPIKCFGRVIAIIYGDFGTKTGSLVHIELIDIVARQAGMVLENTMYKKKLGNSHNS